MLEASAAVEIWGYNKFGLRGRQWVHIARDTVVAAPTTGRSRREYGSGCIQDAMPSPLHPVRAAVRSRSR